MRVVGLTGSIGMGKSSAAKAFEALGIRVHSADETVHRLYRGRAVPLVEGLFPGTVREGVVEREALARRVLNDAEALRALEALVHPMVREEEALFLAEARRAGAKAAILDIPLLFETGRDEDVDEIVVVSAPFAIQRERVLARPRMSEEKFLAILEKQMPDAEKRRRATHVVETGVPIEETRRRIGEIAAGWGVADS